MTPEYVTFSNLIVDDIVLSDGRSFMNTLGGAGTHVLIGMRVWSERLGLVASVGADCDIRHRSSLEDLGVDLRGLVEREGYKTARAWQLFEPDDRVEIVRRRVEADDDVAAAVGKTLEDGEQDLALVVAGTVGLNA